jgi:uncharacterized membrane protein
MRGRFFWFAVFLVATVAVHLAYVLYLPGYRMGRIIAEAEAASGVNRLAVLPEAAQLQIFGYANGFATAVCPFDLADGPARLEAVFPAVPWSLAIYSERGVPVYAVNDRQAGADRFAVRIQSIGALRDLLRSDDEPVSKGNEFTVETYGNRGLAVLRAAIPEPAQESLIAETLRQSTCKVAG